MKKKHIPWVVILAVLLADQVLKVLVKTNMTLGESIPVIGNWFILHFTENYGMAFGMEISGEYGKLLLSLFRIIAVVFIGIYLHSQVKQHAATGLLVCISLILAGALGNIIDSAFYGMVFSESYFNQVATFLPEGGGYDSFLHGKVVDMLYFPLIRGHFPDWFPWWAGQDFIFFRPVFNLADASITTGVFILLVFQRRYFAEPKKTAGPGSHDTFEPSEPADTSEPGESIDTIEPGEPSNTSNSREPIDTSDTSAPRDAGVDEQAAPGVPPEIQQK